MDNVNEIIKEAILEDTEQQVDYLMKTKQKMKILYLQKTFREYYY